ncbi:Phosphoglycolate phosphatase [Caprobacter fermentans]|uniref:Phosphoglycolate phosphatase n=1 Tax=Caproicibacter fermentans TaxID=2576756 RepID=A0A6N8HWG4_9FIRM|nr:HAD family hydrolase [Caproicibacter fermentans]MVB09890.1 Phosphoglycolate phosphatase [Caproicibacter fermentans]OCN00327.1 HAD family hydrolase [Clostridium sp. W14A]
MNIIFDIDGTLWDSTKVVAAAWARAVREIGGTFAEITPAVLKKEFGKSMDVIADDLFREADSHTKNLLIRQCCKNEQEALEKNTENLLYPGTKETIEQLSKDHRLFIVSNCQSGYIELFLKKSETQRYISDFESFGNTGKSKGENIRLLMERNGLKDAVYIGDTQGDRDAAAAAGIPFVYAAYGFGNVPVDTKKIDSIKEVLELMR